MPHQIYLVEDHPVMQQAYASLLSREADLELCGASVSAEDAMPRLAASGCDLLITDLFLPGIDGIELTRRLLAEHPDLPVVVISVHDEAAYVDRARAAGARAYLSKDGLARTLAGTLRAVIRGEAEGRWPSEMGNGASSH